MRGILPGLLLFAAPFAGCVETEVLPCTTAGDCATNEHCAHGVCRAGGGLAAGDHLRDADCTDEGRRVSIRYNLDVLDLDTGNVLSAEFGAPFGWDVIAVFNSGREPPSTLFHNTGEGTLLAHTDVPFCAVDDAHADALPLTRNFLDVPFRTTVVVATTQGRRFALGEGRDDRAERLELSFVEVSP